ncbi:MAG TPA: bifunctional hydroxymethylpyrimidine kinase/phosphomethylpyrimidine kinase [candidate division Zixibacteria bacterium]|nr:bifunctional hydroxymethylpyrimidine kinase/phosphomethylpyrimidine kinase [candidate division Zixibacteria bacterium]HEQ99096.1 bifunctional hydroxymethylpyrimidine kinase/phosphomethylpyrimidine kinase [candidate division Zixibacteria bacterium]
MRNILPVVLTIAGSDSGGGAGIQADLKTFSSLGTFGTTVITAITSQNLEGVRSIQAVKADIVRDQIESVFDGFKVNAVKTGMLFSSEIIETVAETIRKYDVENLVIDPVFAATSGSRLIEDDGIEALTEELFPMAKVITPNIPEAEFLTGMEIKNKQQMTEALEALIELYPASVFVLKGGHLDDAAIDVYGGKSLAVNELKSDKVTGVNNHGSGCTFASAVAAYLAHGHEIEESLNLAKNFISGALRNSLGLEQGINLIDHFWRSEKGIH